MGSNSVLNLNSSLIIYSIPANNEASLFAGIEYIINDEFKFKTEFDPTITPGRVGYEEKSSNLNFALDYRATNTLLTSVSFERGNYVGVKFVITDKGMLKLN